MPPPKPPTAMTSRNTVQGKVEEDDDLPQPLTSTSPQLADADVEPTDAQGGCMKVVRAVVGCLYGSLSEPGAEEDFRVQMQKIMCVVFLLISPYPVTMVIYYLVVRIQGDHSAGILFWVAAGLVTAACWVIPWVYVRVTKRSHDALLDLAVAGFNCALMAYAIGSSQTPLQVGGIMGCLFASLAGTKWYPLHVLAACMGHFMQIFNEAYQGTGRWTFQVQPRYGPPLEHLLMLFAGLAASVVISLGMRLGTDLLVRKGRLADGSVRLARLAAEKLVRYDTDGVREVLRGFEDCDDELLASFYKMVEQLELYRPHLPNWLLQRVNETNPDEDEGGDEDDADGGDSAIQTEQSVTLPSFGSTVGRKRPSYTPLPEKPSTGHTVSFPGRLESSVSLPRADSHLLSRTGRFGEVDSSGEITSSGSMASLTHKALRRSFGSLRRTRATVGLIHFEVDRALAAAAETLTAFVDLVHAKAATSGAALHSFLGDCISLSWNTASKVSQPEVKACRFLCALAQDAAQEEKVRVGGAVFTGEAVVGMSGSKQMVLTMAKLPFEAALGYASNIAVRHGVMVACSRTIATAGLVMEAYPFDVVGARPDARHGGYFMSSPANSMLASVSDELSPSPTESSPPSVEPQWVLYVVEKEKQQQDVDDEWMYQLERSAAQPSALLVDAVKALLLKDCAKASDILASLPADYLHHRPILHALVRKMECHRLRRASASVEQGPTQAFRPLGLPLPGAVP